MTLLSWNHMLVALLFQGQEDDPDSRLYWPVPSWGALCSDLTPSVVFCLRGMPVALTSFSLAKLDGR